MYHVGIDVGSTTIKCVVLDSDNKIVYQSYQRHRAMIKEKTQELLKLVENEEWNSRGWNTRQGIRYNLILLCKELVQEM